MRCVRCSSYAINHGSHGRDGSDGDLCDVCYWRARAEHPVVDPPCQPLTDEQIDGLSAATFLAIQDVPDELVSGRTWDRMFAQAIERAHKIGGAA